MPRVQINYDEYKVKAFLDANIILEGRPLPELPWREIDADGPILGLLTLTAIKEIDSKKHDGRVGRIARAFSKLISPVATGGPPVVLRESGPRVELALASAARIPWDQHDELDPADGDSCIVAEVMYARGMGASGKLIVSHDIKPLTFASNYDVATLHVSDSWLRQPEPGPVDRENQRLRQRIAQYEATEPAFDISIEMIGEEPVSIVHIEDLSDTERTAIQHKIHELKPPVNQVRGTYGLMSGLGYFDTSYDSRFEAYRRRIPTFLASYAQKLERLFNQTRFAVQIVNIGTVQAENVLVEVNVSNGWLHDRYVFVSPQGPSAPRPREAHYLHIPNIGPVISPRVGRHEFEFKEEPDCGSLFAVTCEDFRAGQEWKFEGIVTLDARAGETSTITVSITASNFRGSAERNREITRKVETIHVSKLVDLDSLKITAPVPMQELIDRGENLDAIHWNALDDE